MEENLYTKLLKEPTIKYTIKDNRLYRIKGEKELKVIRRFELEPILFMVHDDPTAGHFNFKTMNEKLKERYYWPKMNKDIEDYAKSCERCQRRGKEKNKGKLNSIEIKEPFYQIGIDIVGPLPLTERKNKYIVVAIDYFTKYPEAKAIPEATAKEVSEFIYEDIICRHGCPQKILSDRGRHFNNQVIENLTKKFNIKHHFSTPYHPQTNGLVERFNGTLCESLAKLSEKEEEWDKYIAPALFAYRTRKQNSTKIPPFYLTYGRKARLPMEEEQIREITLVERIEHLIENLPKKRNEAKQNNKKAQEKQKEYHDKKIKKTQYFKIGDKVLYYNAAKEKQWSGKLADKWKGPYYIHEVLLKGSYRLKEIEGQLLKTPVNGIHLKKYKDRQNYVPYVVI